MPPRTRGQSRGEPRTAKPKNDVYVGLLIISFLAMVAGTVLMALDYSNYADKPKDPGRPPAAQAPQGGVPGGAVPGGGAPVAPPGGPGAPGGPPAPGGPAVPPPMPMPPAMP
jgi:hypothetical protein